MQYTGEHFEDEVRRVCRLLFSKNHGEGAQKVDGRERDGIFFSGDFYTVVEATTDKRKDKALYDAKKTNDLVIKKRQDGFMAQGFVITLHDPTADQRSAVKKYERTTKIMSFDELRSRLFDAHSYLRIRAEKPFGSIYDHAKQEFSVPRSDFVEPSFFLQDDGSVELGQIYQKFVNGEKQIFLADYGVGKSMVLREIFFRLYNDFRNGASYKFPVAINLRDHIGQDDPVELLERHARHNGQDPQKLVAAWSAGFVDLLIDGFDELSTRGWTGDHRRLREFRRSTHAILKKLVRATPIRSSILVTGREAYFDSIPELREALGAPVETFKIYNIQPFDVSQARKFLINKGLAGDLPDWAPTRPLFLNYLIGRNLLTHVLEVEQVGAFPDGGAWVSLLDMIAERESDQSEGVDKRAILDFLAALSSKARQGKGVDRSFSPSDMDQIFYNVTGNTVSDDERRLLLRLPGLGIAADNLSNRSFVDEDFMNVCSAGAIYEFINYPYSETEIVKDMRLTSNQLNEIGISALCSKLDRSGTPYGVLRAAIDQEFRSSDGKGGHLAFDLLWTSIQIFPETAGPFSFEGVDINNLDLSGDYNSGLQVYASNCLIEKLILPVGSDDLPSFKFNDCLIGLLDGRSSENDLPDGMFSDCEISGFSEDFTVNSGVMAGSTPIGVRVLVVTLRKIFSQAGSSRVEGALVRGLDHRARLIAPEVISLLLSKNFISEFTRGGRRFFSGNKSLRKNALSIITSPMTCGEEIVTDCLMLA